MRQAMYGLNMVLVVMASSGCLTLGPRCATRSVQMSWTDGIVTEMPITVCGFDWRAGRVPPQPDLKAAVDDDGDNSRTASLRREIARAKRVVDERLIRPLSAFFRRVQQK